MQEPPVDLIRPLYLNEVGVGAGVCKELLSSSSQGDTKQGREETTGLEEDPGDESRKPQVARQPHTHSRAEVLAHLPLHLEYRSWCPHCRAGKGISMQHRTNLDEEATNLGATVSVDYSPHVFLHLLRNHEAIIKRDRRSKICGFLVQIRSVLHRDALPSTAVRAPRTVFEV